MSLRTRYWTEIQAAAKKYALDPVLVEAVVVQESAGNCDAFRFEPKFFVRYLKNKPGWWSGMNPRRVSSSYGLLQVMFVVAVEDGLDPKTPPEMLFIPEIGLNAGCTRLSKCIDWANSFPGTPEERLAAALASYNGGKNSSNKPGSKPLLNGKYASEVLAKFKALRDEHQSI